MDDLTLIAVLSAHAQPHVAAEDAWEIAVKVARDAPRPITEDGLRDACLTVTDLAMQKGWNGLPPSH